MTSTTTPRLPMKHFIELTPDEFSSLDSPFLTPMKTTYSAGDELAVTVKDHREQAVLTITRVIKDKVNGKWCYLCLSGIDDLKGLFEPNGRKEDAENDPDPKVLPGYTSKAAPAEGADQLHY